MTFSDQAANALRSMNPGVRKDIRRALDDVELGKRRDVKALTNELQGFMRLRVGRWRIIYRFHETHGKMIVEFIEERGSVYEKFASNR